MDQQYVLRWNKHHENLSDGVISYFERGLMCDVTITVGPRQKLKAHQAILSACSPYFESVFTEYTHQQNFSMMIVMMVNVDYEILKAIIEYMYKGEVNIAQKLLPDFLKTAAHFQVKGLVDTENISHNASDYDQHLSSASPTIPPSDNETIEFGNTIRRRLHNHHHHLIERRSSMIDKFEENESDLMHRDDLDVSDRITSRAELSPILSGSDQSRKRRKDSICDNSLQKRQREREESHASSHSSYKVSPLPKLNSNEEDAERKGKSPSNANILPQQPSIKQEEVPEPGSPQVHLPSTNSLNHHHLYTMRLNDKLKCTTEVTVPQSSNHKLFQPPSSASSSSTTSMSHFDETEKNLSKIYQNTQQLFCFVAKNPSISFNSSNSIQAPSTSTRKAGRFRVNWLDQFKWLQYDEVNNTMFCIFCRKWSGDFHDIRTSFVEGNSNFRLEIVNHHDKCKAHKLCHERELKALQQQQQPKQ